MMISPKIFASQIDGKLRDGDIGGLLNRGRMKQIHGDSKSLEAKKDEYPNKLQNPEQLIVCAMLEVIHRREHQKNLIISRPCLQLSYASEYEWVFFKHKRRKRYLRETENEIHECKAHTFELSQRQFWIQISISKLLISVCELLSFLLYAHFDLFIIASRTGKNTPHNQNIVNPRFMLFSPSQIYIASPKEVTRKRTKPLRMGKVIISEIINPYDTLNWTEIVREQTSIGNHGRIVGKDIASSCSGKIERNNRLRMMFYVLCACLAMRRGTCCCCLMLVLYLCPLVMNKLCWNHLTIVIMTGVAKREPMFSISNMVYSMKKMNPMFLTSFLNNFVRPNHWCASVKSCKKLLVEIDYSTIENETARQKGRTDADEIFLIKEVVIISATRSKWYSIGIGVRLMFVCHDTLLHNENIGNFETLDQCNINRFFTYSGLSARRVAFGLFDQGTIDCLLWQIRIWWDE